MHSTSPHTHADRPTGADALREAIAHAAHLLPSQSPLDRFVHHNPLHAFEHLPFEEAVVEASQIWDTEPFLAEAAYRDAMARGRVHDRDLDEVIRAQIADGPVAGVVDRRALAKALLLHPIAAIGGELLAWTLSETDALTATRPDLAPEARASILAEAGGDACRALHRLWDACRVRPLPTPPTAAEPRRIRVRDHLVAAGGDDPDPSVDSVLIRWCAAYLDQGVAYWPMGDRAQGFYACFLVHFDQPGAVARPWARELRRLVARARQEGWDAEAMSLHALRQLGHPEESWSDVVLRTLLALRGWAGMFQRLTDRPDVAPELRLPTAVADVLAVRLALDLSAAAWLARDLPPGPSLLDRVHALPARQVGGPTATEGAPPIGDPAWYLFQLCQVLGLGAHALEGLSDAAVHTLLDEAWRIGPVVRRRLWHLAYERRHRVETLDAVSVHARRVARRSPEPVRVQCAFCIDDREESLRRHLEEVAPWAETLGIAGNYGISMYYRGLEHGHPVALGPAGFEPKHLVVERAPAAIAPRTRLQGLLTHNLDVGSQTLLRGALVAIGGWAASLPLTLRLLAPRLHARLIRRVLPVDTELELERTDEDPDEHGLLRGFTLDEQVDVVRGTLELMGLVRDFAPLVCCFGHGSHSMNNPHEAAHDCGACGGGQGGPNARAFARMANDPRVRERLRADGVDIPDGTWFVGGYHDTADDAVDWYDLRLVPSDLRGLLDETVAALDEARPLDAHERCRKFENAALDLDPAGALLHVENRAEDLAQPRPEYGHATNALCFVGRRAWSRGLFLDRRAFLVSYDPDTDPEREVLARLLAMVVPVGAGISLEYWFSVVDPVRYGCGTKLPHNITGLVGVMDGHASDLRTGLPWQMVEIHEPVRLLCVVEAPPSVLLRIAGDDPAVGRLVVNGWVQLASLDPKTGALQVFEDGAFRPWRPESERLPIVARSADWYAGARGLLPPASVLPDDGGSGPAPSASTPHGGAA